MATAVRKVNWFAIWTSIIVVVIVIGVGVAVVVANNMSNDPGTRPTASNIDTETGAVSVGKGEDQVDTYIDFMCPICGEFEGVYGEQLQTLAAEDKITLNLHPVAILDRFSQGTAYSTRAANAFYCVADTDGKAVLPFMSALFENQPAENSSGLTDDELIKYAKDAGADIATCQTPEEGSKLRKFEKFVGVMTKAMPADPASGGQGTPTVTINGEYTTLGTIGASGTFFTDKFGAATTSTETPKPEETAATK